jgi:hypothetical protein
MGFGELERRVYTVPQRALPQPEYTVNQNYGYNDHSTALSSLGAFCGLVVILAEVSRAPSRRSVREIRVFGTPQETPTGPE